METPAVFSSWADLTGRYLKSRFPARLYIPCAAFLMIAGLAGGPERDPARAALAGALALGLLLQFRLMDDLADRDCDRLAHPDRVLPQAPSLIPFNALLALAFLFNGAVIAARPAAGHRLPVFLILTAAALCWYGWVRAFLTDTVAGYHVVVAKYPVFTYLVSAESSPGRRLLLAMALVYLCFALYEALHDDGLRTSPAVNPALALETGALFAVAMAMAADLSKKGAALALLQVLLACAGLAVLTRLIGRRRTGPWSSWASYLVFAIGLALSVTFSIGELR